MDAGAPRAPRAACASAGAAATTSGTIAGGSTNSIGTKMSCVGTVAPVPVSNSQAADDGGGEHEQQHVAHRDRLVELERDEQHGDDHERQAHERVGPQLARLHPRRGSGHARPPRDGSGPTYRSA